MTIAPHIKTGRSTRRQPLWRQGAALFCVFCCGAIVNLACEENNVGSTIHQVKPGLAASLESHVVTLAGKIGERNVYHPEAYEAATDYIAAAWRSYGYEVGRHPFEAYQITCHNLDASVEGETLPGEIIIVGAHYDSVRGSPGANDNASGVAALLEISKTLAGMKLKRTIRFVAFANEEPPFFQTHLMGSRIYAQEAREQSEKIVGVINLETIGHFDERHKSQDYPPLVGLFYPDTANFVAFVSDLGSWRWTSQVTSAFKANSSFPYQRLSLPPQLAVGIDFSDHASFWEESYPAVMVTDTAFYRYAPYHTRHDLPHKLNYQALAAIVEGLTGSIIELARR